MQMPSSVPPALAPGLESPPLIPPLPATPPPPATLAPWAWATAVVLGQPTAHRLIHAFFFGLIGLVTVLLGAARGCR